MLPGPNVDLAVLQKHALNSFRDIKAARLQRNGDSVQVHLAVSVLVANKIDGTARNPIVKAVDAVRRIKEQVSEIGSRGGLSKRRSGEDDANKDNGALLSDSEATFLLLRAQSCCRCDCINQHRVRISSIDSGNGVLSSSSWGKNVGLEEKIDFLAIVCKSIGLLRRCLRIDGQNVNASKLRKRNGLFFFFFFFFFFKK